MKKRFLILPFLILFLSLSFNSVYAQEEIDTEQVEIQLLEEAENSEDKEEVDVYTKEEVEQHEIESDCWVSFEGFVYDLSEYVPNHDKFLDIREWCGKDITEDFKDKAGVGRDHREGAYTLLETYKIAKLKGDFDMVDTQVTADEVSEEEGEEVIVGTYDILLPFLLTTALYWIGFFLAKYKAMGMTVKRFNGFWNTVLLLTLLIPGMAFGIFMIVRTQRPELWDVDFDFMYWHVELSLVMGFAGIYHLVQRYSLYLAQFKKKESN